MAANLSVLAYADEPEEKEMPSLTEGTFTEEPDSPEQQGDMEEGELPDETEASGEMEPPDESQNTDEPENPDTGELPEEGEEPPVPETPGSGDAGEAVGTDEKDDETEKAENPALDETPEKTDEPETGIAAVREAAPLELVKLPSQVFITLDPYEIQERGQIFSEPIEVVNNSRETVKIVSSLWCETGGDVELSEEYAYGFASDRCYTDGKKPLNVSIWDALEFDGGKQAQVFLRNMDTGETEVFSGKEKTVEFLLEGGKTARFEIAGNMTLSPQDGWSSQDINVRISFWAEEMEKEPGINKGTTENPDVENPINPLEPGTPENPAAPTEPEQPTEPADPVEPTKPEQPTEPSDPAEPTEPEQPAEPADPTEPEQPVEPADPVEPTEPEQPAEPSDPAEPTKPEQPTEPADPAEPEQPVEPSDLAEPTELEQPTEPAADPVEPTEPEQLVEPTNPAGT